MRGGRGGEDGKQIVSINLLPPYTREMLLLRALLFLRSIGSQPNDVHTMRFSYVYSIVKIFPLLESSEGKGLIKGRDERHRAFKIEFLPRQRCVCARVRT